MSDANLVQALLPRLITIRRCNEEPFSLVNLRSYLLATVEIFFADKNLRQGFDRALECLIYNPADGKDDTVFIELGGKREVEGDNRFPKITVMLGDFTPVPLSMNRQGDLEPEEHDDGATRNMLYGAPDQVARIVVETLEEAQALAIAEGLMAYFISVYENMSNLPGIRGILPAGIVMPKYNKDHKTWVASTGMRLNIDYSVRIREESPLLKKVVMELQRVPPLT